MRFLITLLLLGGFAPPNYRILVASESGDIVTQLVWDGTTLTVAKVVPVGIMPADIDGPHNVTVAPDGSAWYVTIAHGTPYGSLWKLGAGTDSLLGRAQADENLREAVRTRWVEPRRQVAREIVCRGIQSGELRPGLDPDVVLDALYGPFYHRLLVPYNNGAISDRFIDALVDTVFGGLEPRGAKALVQSDPQDV